MPYKLDGNCVVKADTGKVVKCHSSKGEAEAHLHALQMNVGDAGNSSKDQGSSGNKAMNDIMRKAAGKKKR